MKIKNPFKLIAQTVADFIDFKKNKKEYADFLRKGRKLQGQMAHEVIMRRISERSAIRASMLKRKRRYSKYRAKRQNKFVGTVVDISFYEAVKIQLPGTAWDIPESVRTAGFDFLPPGTCFMEN